MSPGVGGDLVAFGVHALDHCGMSGCGVDGAFADVGAGNEEGGLAAVGLEQVKDVRCVAGVGPVVVGDGDGAGVLAAVDASAAVRDSADLRAGDVGSAAAGGSDVFRAGGAVLPLAAGGVAVVGAGTAPYISISDCMGKVGRGRSYSLLHCSTGRPHSLQCLVHIGLRHSDACLRIQSECAGPQQLWPSSR